MASYIAEVSEIFMTIDWGLDHRKAPPMTGQHRNNKYAHAPKLDANQYPIIRTVWDWIAAVIRGLTSHAK
jgi:hypothetical protein